MENKNFQKWSVAALIFSVLPLATFIPIVFHIKLTDGVRSAWAGANILSAFAGWIISILCVKNREKRNMVNIISTVISSFWMLLIGGSIALALFISFAL